MICPDCGGSGRAPDGLKPCGGCIGGIASCCDAAGAEGSAEKIRMHPAIEHVASSDCWCGPTEDGEGVYLHHERVRQRWEGARATGREKAYLYALPPSGRA